MEDRHSLSWFVFTDNFSDLRLLLTTIEQLITREENSEIERLSAYADALPEHARSEYWANNHPYQWDDIIAPQFRASFFLTLMAAAEYHLTHLLADAGVVARVNVAPQDLKVRGGFYARARAFLETQCGITTIPATRWSWIEDLQEVRNALAHNGTMITDDRRGRRVKAFAKCTPGLSADRQQIELSREFCESVLEKVSEFIREVWAEFWRWCELIKASEASSD
jgi:hypothetical protein